jgi:hypothetical protein
MRGKGIWQKLFRLIKRCNHKVGVVDKMKLEMSPSISVAALKSLAHGQDNVQIHIHQNAIQISGGRQEVPEFITNIPPMDEQALFCLIQNLPEPRLTNLVSSVYMIALKMLGGNKSATSKWLGVSYKNVCRRTDSKLLIAASSTVPANTRLSP